MDALLARVHLGAALSLEPLLDLVGTLARDLQADFVPFFAPVMGRLSALAETEGATHLSPTIAVLFFCTNHGLRFGGRRDRRCQWLTLVP